MRRIRRRLGTSSSRKPRLVCCRPSMVRAKAGTDRSHLQAASFSLEVSGCYMRRFARFEPAGAAVVAHPLVAHMRTGERVGFIPRPKTGTWDTPSGLLRVGDCG